MDSNDFRGDWYAEEHINEGNLQLEQPSVEVNHPIPNQSELNLDNVYSYPTPKQQKRSLGSDQISELHLRKKNLCSFVENIGRLAHEPIRRDIINHCQKVSFGMQSNISSDQVIKLTKNRVQKMIKNKRIKKNWSEQDIKILVWIISKYCQMQNIGSSKDDLQENDWEYIANLIPGVTPKSCMFKWLGLKKNNLAQNSWVQEESNLLNYLVNTRGEDKWGLISELLYEENKLPQKIYRCPKQCREHWNCYLNPQLKKGPWQKKEDVLLLKAVKELNGAKKWAEIVKLFNGRTQNALKNRYNLIVEKQYREFRGRRKPTEFQIIQHYLKKNQNSVSLQKSKLKTLQQKKISLGQVINKKQKKQTDENIKPSKKKLKQLSDSDEYDPNEGAGAFRDRKKVQNKEKKKANQVRSYEAFYNSNTPIYCNKDESYHNIIFTKKKQGDQDDRIFEQEEEDLMNGNQEMIKSIQRQNNQKYKEEVRKCYAEEENQFSYDERKQTMSPSPRYGKPENGNNEEQINIDMNAVTVISLDTLSFERLRNQFKEQNQTFVPCRLVDDCILRYSSIHNGAMYPVPYNIQDFNIKKEEEN